MLDHVVSNLQVESLCCESANLMARCVELPERILMLELDHAQLKSIAMIVLHDIVKSFRPLGLSYLPLLLYNSRMSLLLPLLLLPPLSLTNRRTKLQ